MKKTGYVLVISYASIYVLQNCIRVAHGIAIYVVDFDSSSLGMIIGRPNWLVSHVNADNVDS